MRRIFQILVLTLLPTGVIAEGVSQQEYLVHQLQEQGYRVLSIKKTFLGRARIVSTNGSFRRETVINVKTGYVLRDIWRVISNTDGGGSSGATLVNPNSGNRAESDEGSSSGTSGQGDDDEDDYDDYDDDDSESESDDESDDAEDSEDESDDDSGDSEDESDEDDEDDD